MGGYAHENKGRLYAKKSRRAECGRGSWKGRDFNGIIRLNDTGRFLWEKLANDMTEEQLAAALLAEYDIDEAGARSDISEFIAKLRKAELLA